MTLRMNNFPMTALIIAMAAAGVTGVAQAKGHGPAPVSFAELDTNSDGFLTVDEIEAAGKEKAAKRAARMIKHLDSDEDGKLSAEEMNKRGKGRSAKMFERFDTDKNGSFLKEEFAAASEKMGKRKGKKTKHSE